MENKGTGTTGSPFWQDQLWLSRDSEINSGDIFLKTVHKESGLMPNGKYEVRSVMVSVHTFIDASLDLNDLSG